MTTRHTISYADTLYAGNAFHGGYSPDGRRGVERTHLYLREYGAVDTSDVDGLVTQQSMTSGVGTVTLALVSTAAYVSSSATNATLDVPRNLVFHSTTAGVTTVKFEIKGVDEYGATMTESKFGPSKKATVSAIKAFKTVNMVRYVCTVAAQVSGAISVGTGPRLGLPFWAANAGRIAAGSINGSASGGGTFNAGVTQSATHTSSKNAKDVRGTYTFGASPDNSKLFSILMKVDASTRNKAFGAVPSVTYLA